MPALGLPLFADSPLAQRISIRIYLCSGAPAAAMDRVRAAVTMARRILRPHAIAVAVSPGPIEEIETIAYGGVLAQMQTDQWGRNMSNGAGGVTARSEVERLDPAAGRDSCVVIFGRVASPLRGRTEDQSRFPPFVCCSWDSTVATTMLHETMHAAGCQHYMAYANLLDPRTMDPRNIMAEAPDSTADLRTELNTMELQLLRQAPFFSNAAP